MEQVRIGAERAGKRAEDVEIVDRAMALATDDKVMGRNIFRAAFAPEAPRGGISMRLRPARSVVAALAAREVAVLSHLESSRGADEMQTHVAPGRQSVGGEARRHRSPGARASESSAVRIRESRSVRHGCARR